MIKTIKKIIKSLIKIKNYVFIKSFMRKYRNSTLIWIYPHIGDMFYGLTYLNKFKCKYKLDNVTLIGNERYEELYKCFKGIDYFVLMPEKKVWRFAFNCCGQKAIEFLRAKINEGVYFTNDFEFFKTMYPIRDDEGCLNYTRRVVYKLDCSCEYEKPQFPIVDVEIRDVNRVILLSPYAQSVSGIPIEYFNKLANELNSRGFIVYTNVTANEKEIDRTKRLQCSLFQLYSIARYARAFIGLRSGICDLLAMTDIPMYVLFNDYPIAHFATLKEFRSDIQEYYGLDYDKYIVNILEDLDNAN